MGHAGTQDFAPYTLSWADLSRAGRKAFHRENESRIRRGLDPLKKEKVSLRRYGNGGY